MDEHELERLRRSVDLRLDGEGQWWHEGERVTHARMHEALSRGIGLSPLGEPIVRLGSQQAYFRCDRTPFLVKRLRVEPSGLTVQLNNEELIQLKQPDLWLDQDVLYVRLDEYRTASFTRLAQQQVAPWLVLDPAYSLVCGDWRAPIRQT